MMVYGNTSPEAQEAHRREVQWIYGQSAPGILGGDFYYYSIDYHLTLDQVKKIDTAKVRVHLMTSEYGPGSGADGMATVAAQIPGAAHTMIKGAGYLPMTDDYPRLREALRPVMDQVRRKHGSL